MDVCIFFGNTLHSVGSSSVIVRGWRTCVIGRNSFRTIYMPRGNCVSGARMPRGPLFRWQRLSLVLATLGELSYSRQYEGGDRRMTPR